MTDQKDIELIKKTIEDFFRAATINLIKTDVSYDNDAVNAEIEISDPQILIGEKGQTLFEVQRLLKVILNRKLGRIFYLNLDINSYKKKKAEYLSSIAKDLADEVAVTKQPKELVPMSSYERKIIHAQLSQRSDVVTKSSGEGKDRHIIIEPRQ